MSNETLSNKMLPNSSMDICLTEPNQPVSYCKGGFTELINAAVKKANADKSCDITIDLARITIHPRTR